MCRYHPINSRKEVRLKLEGKVLDCCLGGQLEEVFHAITCHMEHWHVKTFEGVAHRDDEAINGCMASQLVEPACRATCRALVNENKKYQIAHLNCRLGVNIVSVM